MCLHPQFIPNPNYRRKKTGFNVLKDCTSFYIPVPCGHCPQCIALRQMSIVQRVYMESINNYLFFCTLTYSSDALPTVVIGDFEIPFADFTHIQKMFKRLRKSNAFSRPFRYFVVSEFGSKHGRPHFHILFSLPKLASDSEHTPFSLELILYHAVFNEWRRNVGTIRNPIYKSNFVYAKKFVGGKMYTNFDLHYIVPNLSDSGVADCAYYVSKYMLKPSDRESNLQQALKLNLSEEEFNHIWKDIKNIHTMSKGFGLLNTQPNKFDSLGHDIDVGAYIRKCIYQSIKDGLSFPCFIIPDSGKMIPLSRFYRKYYLYVDDAYSFYYNQKDQSHIDTLFETKIYDDPRYREMIRQFQKSLSIVDNSDNLDIV